MYGDKVYADFRGLNVPEDNVAYEHFTIISIDSLFVYKNKYYLKVYLANFACKIVNTEMIDYLNYERFKPDLFFSLINAVLGFELV